MKQHTYYSQGFEAFSKGSKCAYAPTSRKGLEWAYGYADAELASFSPAEETMPTLEDAQNAEIDCEACGENCEDCS